MPKKLKSHRTMIGYKTYNFRDKDPIIDVMRTAIKVADMTYTEVAESSGVSASTLTGWFRGITRRPQFATVNAVAIAIGKELVLMSSKHSKPAKLRKVA